MRPDFAPQASAPQRWLCVSLHDVAPATWAACERVLAAVREVARIPLTLLVVPAYHGECSAQHEFERAMTAQLAAGHELALHGYFHLDPQVPSDVIDWFRRRIYTAGEGEFCGLSEEEARERLTLGARWFAARGWPLAGFVAPAWLLGPGAWKALRTRDGLQYTSTLTKLVALPEAHAIPAPCLTYSVRSAWRRPTSIVWNTVLSRITHHSPVLRLGLHPNDADSSSVRCSWQRLLERALTDREAVTKAEFVRQWRLKSVSAGKRPPALRPLSESLS
ncbi:MAG: polysaccharide deacetylase family protein [Burkholderiaceae bacterium]